MIRKIIEIGQFTDAFNVHSIKSKVLQEVLAKPNRIIIVLVRSARTKRNLSLNVIFCQITITQLRFYVQGILSYSGQLNKDKDKDKRHLERFSDPVTLKVTQLTIPDKMRNCNHDIEG